MWDLSFLEYIVYGNSVFAYLSALLLFVLILLISKLLDYYLIIHAKKDKNEDKEEKIHHIEILKSISSVSYIITAIFLSSRVLNISQQLNQIVLVVFVIIIFFQASITLHPFIQYLLEKIFHKEEPEKIIGFITSTTRIILGTLIFFFLLNNLGININGFLAGVGIIGVVVAIGLQNILADLFSSFAIYLDKPFEVGDAIMFGQDIGVIKKIGIKTTRIASMQGEELIITNADILHDIIHNFKRMQSRRASFQFRIPYSTSNEKILAIIDMVKSVFDKIEKATLSRANITQFGEYGLVLEVVYYVNSSDYNVYIALNQDIILRIKEGLEILNVNIEIPSSHVYFENKQISNI